MEIKPTVLIVSGLHGVPFGQQQYLLVHGGIVFVLDKINIMGHTLCVNIVKQALYFLQAVF